MSTPEPSKFATINRVPSQTNAFVTPGAPSPSTGLKRTVADATTIVNHEIVAEYVLSKNQSTTTTTTTQTIDNDEKKDVFNIMLNASKIECDKKKKTVGQGEATANPYNFPSNCRNILRRKQNVNLYIKDEQVIWQFRYDPIVISAVKTIKGRQWNPKIGERGCWVCPIETLPECIALYEFMGRTPDKNLKDRAADITRLYNGGSASDTIKISVKFSLPASSVPPSQNNNQHQQQNQQHISSFGTADFSFLYDAEVVTSLKMVPPSFRNYDPDTKMWTIQLLALPHALEFLSEIGYLGLSEALKDLSESLASLDSILHGEHDTSADSEVIPDRPSSNTIKIEGVSETQIPLTSSSTSPDETMKSRNAKLKETVKQIGSILRGSKKESDKQFDRSDCGHAKQRRLTSAQIEYSNRLYCFESGWEHDYIFDDHIDNFLSDHSSDDGLELDSMLKSEVYPSVYSPSRSIIHKPITINECDCGRPNKKIGGVHVCRYFGKFDCPLCGNAWTSAYCWKGEAQSCRMCNTESMPVMKENLKQRDNGSNKLCRNTKGAHDSSRCAMCRKLGRNCSESY